MLHFHIDEYIDLELLLVHHADELFALTDRNRNHLQPWLPWVDSVHSIEDTLTFIQDGLKQFADHNGFTCGIRYHKQLAGCIGYHKVDWRNQKTKIGYWVSAEYQGKGIVTRACQALIRYGFEEMHLNRLEIRAAVQNVRSRAVPERLGFINEGILRQVERVQDKYLDHVVYSMLATEFYSTSQRV